jgi:hypothetical protein
LGSYQIPGDSLRVIGDFCQLQKAELRAKIYRDQSRRAFHAKIHQYPPPRPCNACFALSGIPEISHTPANQYTIWIFS